MATCFYCKKKVPLFACLSGWRGLVLVHETMWFCPEHRGRSRAEPVEQAAPARPPQGAAQPLTYESVLSDVDKKGAP